MNHVLIVEDEPNLADLLKDYLQAADFHTNICHDGQVALDWLENNETDLIVLDLMLPSIDGVQVCKKVRTSSDVPIIMATAKVEEIDRILGLNIGADDYVCKPYSPKELIARIRAILRRVGKTNAPEDCIVSLDKNTLSIKVSDQSCELTLIEYKLLELLHSEPGKIFSRQYIMDNIYNDYRVVSDRTVDSHVKKLRKKMNELAPSKQFIHSIYGAGYKFEDQDIGN